MTTLVANRGAPARRQRRVPWSPRAWGEALYLAGGIPAQLAAVLVGALVFSVIDPRPKLAVIPLSLLAVCC